MLISIKRRALLLGLVLVVVIVTGIVSAAILKDSAGLNELSFVNQNGDDFSFRDLNGTPIVLNYVFTGCSVYCPVQVGSLRVMQKRLNERLGEGKYQLLSVTLTPETDSPTDMKHYAERFSVDLTNWQFATGSESSVNALIEATKAKVIKGGGGYELDHTTFVYLINDKGELTNQFEGIPLDESSLVKSLEAEVSKI